MTTWFEYVDDVRQKLKNLNIDPDDRLGVDNAGHSLSAALYQMAQNSVSSDGLIHLTYRGLNELGSLRQDTFLLAEAIAYEHLGELIRNSDYLAEIVSGWFTSDKLYIPFFKQILNWAYLRPIQNWPESINEAQNIAKGLDLDISSSMLAATLIVAAAVVICLYFIFFRNRKPGKNASPEFIEISKRFHNEDWAKALLKGNAQDWALAEAWQRAALGGEQKLDAIQKLANVSNFGKLVQPGRGAKFNASSMSASDPGAGAFVWECERPGLIWGRDLLEVPQVTCAEAEFIALYESSQNGRELYNDAFKERHSRKPGPTDMLEGGLIEDVYHVLSADVELYDAWLQTLIESCPGNSLVPACADHDEEYVEKRMVSVNQLLVKAEAKVKKRLHRGLIRHNGLTEELLYRALVEAVDREVDDPYDLM